MIAFSGAFHGRTYGSLSATSSNLNYRVGHGPFVPGIHIAPFPAVYRDFAGDEARAVDACLAEVRRLLATELPPQEVAAFLIEPVQGEGGFIPAPAAFLRGLRQLADEHGILLICDEVQCGYGRTGRMWAFEHAGIVPDIVTLAKAIANGLPLSAIVAAARPDGALGPRRARLDVRRQPGRLRRGRGRARDHPRRRARGQRRRPRSGAAGRPARAGGDATRGSATSAGRA